MMTSCTLLPFCERARADETEKECARAGHGRSTTDYYSYYSVYQSVSFLFGMHVNSVLVRSIPKRLRITSASCFPALLPTFTSAGQTCPLHFTVACLYNDFSYKHLIISIANREACAPENDEMRKNVKLMPST